MKFLILGCNGMAGHMICTYLSENGHDVTGFARKSSNKVKTIIGDVKDESKLREVISGGRFDTLVNCVGVLNQRAEEDKAEAAYVNSYLPHLLSKITDNTSTQVIQMSTDCVFSGDRGGYCEYDLKDGLTFYDRSKALGELDEEKNVTIRSSIVGPDQNPNGIGLLNWFMQQGGEINGFERVFWTGQTTLQYAKSVEKAAEARIHGVYNLVPETSISKYDLLQLFNKYFRNNRIIIRPKDNPVSDKSLRRTRFDFDYYVPDYEEMVAQLAVWMRAHKEMYPHYRIE